jgi:hypothetical protein
MTKKEAFAMSILVHFKNNKFEYVENSELDTLIANDAIYAFKIATGWVRVGRDSSQPQAIENA